MHPSITLNRSTTPWRLCCLGSASTCWLLSYALQPSKNCKKEEVLKLYNTHSRSYFSGLKTLNLSNFIIQILRQL